MEAHNSRALAITYRDSAGNQTARTVREVVPVDAGHIEGFCELRGARRTFAIHRIESAADGETGEIIDLYAWLGLQQPEPAAPPSVKQSRSEERRALQRRYRLGVIYELYRARLFDSFGNRCFACGSTATLLMDHYVPFASGGRLEPGNIVALCARCNDRKGDVLPEQFYCERQLETVARLLEQQPDLMAFAFDLAAWDRDRAAYLRAVGVDAATVERVLTDSEHEHYIGSDSGELGLRISAE